MSHWNQAICDPCWAKRHPTIEPVRWTGGKEQRCAWCGEATTSGIFLRARPGSVPFPRIEEEEEE